MFHRPKPETQNETASTQTDAQVNASPVAVVSTPTETTTQTTTQTTKSMEQSAQTGKETTAMTKDQDNKATEDTKSVDIPQTTTSSPFQRPAASGAATTGSAKSYGGTYNPTPYAAAGTSASASPAGNGRRLVIGEGITMSGEIESCDHLLVEGSVEAALKGAKALEISETGKFYGSVEIENATIAGHFEGEINVSGRLTVSSTGVITGSIAHGELQIEAGATLDGRLAPIGAVATTTAKKGKGAAKKNDAELPLAS